MAIRTFGEALVDLEHFMKTLFAILFFAIVALPAQTPLPLEQLLQIGPPKPVTIDDFRAVPIERQLLPDYLVQPPPPPPPPPARSWDMIAYQTVPFHEIQSIVLTGTPPRLKWQTKSNQTSRVVVSDNGTNFWVHAHTRTWLSLGWTEWPVEIPMPTNAYFKVVSP